MLRFFKYVMGVSVLWEYFSVAAAAAAESDADDGDVVVGNLLENEKRKRPSAAAVRQSVNPRGETPIWVWYVCAYTSV